MDLVKIDTHSVSVTAGTGYTGSIQTYSADDGFVFVSATVAPASQHAASWSPDLSNGKFPRHWIEDDGETLKVEPGRTTGFVGPYQSSHNLTVTTVQVAKSIRLCAD